MSQPVENKRLRVIIRGAVQGVGFRPHVYRLAEEMKLSGFVENSPGGVVIEAEGERTQLERFLSRIREEKPPVASIHGMEVSYLDRANFDSFEIRSSGETGEKSALILPDIATCSDCLSEILDPDDRRFGYPFTNCTNCGPRFTILESLPYDRGRTTMKGFPMCEACRSEYEDPSNRRFHAQPNACPECGPELVLWNEEGVVLGEKNEAFLAACQAIREGEVVAVKGLGGFHLMVDARNEEAVHRLRQRKGREEKPLAIMVSSVEMAREVAEISETEARLLTGAEAPIVLLRRRTKDLAPSLAPGNPYLGIMLPYTPLHHLLMRDLGFPIVATSGNRTDEPICIDEREALERLRGIADLFLVHNRPIARYVDDSLVRIIGGREVLLRRARGYAPLPVAEIDESRSLLAVGAHLKNTIAFTVGSNLFLSHHLGDLETPQAVEGFSWVTTEFPKLFDFRADAVACDQHPDYASSRWAKNLQVPRTEVQHHYAHVLSTMADNNLEGEVLGVSWDGTGYGLDGTIWGGEFLTVRKDGWERTARLRTFRLPGGDRAVREPRRSAVGLLYEIWGDDLFEQSEIELISKLNAEEKANWATMLRREINAPVTSSAGRLFDAVSALLGICLRSSFEGQAAMALEFAADGAPATGSYPFTFTDGVLDWEPMAKSILGDLKEGRPAPEIARKFHETLVEMIITVAQKCGMKRIVLTGGCFQNKMLTELAVDRLRAEGFSPYWNQRIPPNDGGIAVGQIMALASR